jgi:hypothetical protein
MPDHQGRIKADFRTPSSQAGFGSGNGERNALQYADIAIAIVGVLIIAGITDQLGGKRGFGGALLVASVGAACGWFLVIRVFATSTMDDWIWILWALGGAALTLLAYYLFRNKR